MRFDGTICRRLCLSALLVTQANSPVRSAGELSPPPLISILDEELDHSMKHLATPDGTKPYSMSYTITDTRAISVRGSLGALHRSEDDHQRTLDVDVRVGDYSLDNTHQIRGRADAGRFGRPIGATDSAPI